MKAKRDSMYSYLRLMIGAVDVIIILLALVLFFAFLVDAANLWPPFKLFIAVVIPVVLTRWVAHLIESEAWRE